MESVATDHGWDVFSLTYRIDALSPLAVIFHQDARRQYVQLFQFLWQLKRLETGCLVRPPRPVARFIPLLRHHMLHCVLTLQSYLMFDVIECEWQNFQTRLTDATSLTMVLEAHDDYITALTRQVLLPRPIAELWTPLAHSIARFASVLRQLEQSSVSSLTQQQQIADKSDWGDSSAQEAYRDEWDRHKLRQQQVLEQIGLEYRQALDRFLQGIETQPAPLRYLAVRLDFNGFYSSSST